MKVIWDGPKYARRAIFWACVFAGICALIAGFLVGTARAADLPQTGDPLWVFYGLQNSCLEGYHNSLCPEKAKPESNRTWHVLVVTYGGTVSLIKDLTKKEAEHTKAKLLGQPYTEKEIAEAKKADEQWVAALAKCSGLHFYCGNYINYSNPIRESDIRSVEAFQ